MNGHAQIDTRYGDVFCGYDFGWWVFGLRCGRASFAAMLGPFYFGAAF